MSQKKVLIAWKGDTNTTKFAVPGETLQKKAAFLDYCMGILSHGCGYSNASIAAMFGKSERRVQLATTKLEAAGLLEKTARKVVVPFSDYPSAKRKSAELEAHKIYHTGPFPLDGGYGLAVPITNRCRMDVFRRYQGTFSERGKKHTGQTYPQRKGRSGKPPQYVKPAFRKRGAIRNHFENRLEAKCHFFDDTSYNLDCFIRDHSSYKYVRDF